MRWNQVSGNNQLHSEPQAIYAVRVKRKRMSKVFSHKDNPCTAKTCSSIEAQGQTAEAGHFYPLHLREEQDSILGLRSDSCLSNLFQASEGDREVTRT